MKLGACQSAPLGSGALAARTQSPRGESLGAKRRLIREYGEQKGGARSGDDERLSGYNLGCIYVTAG